MELPSAYIIKQEMESGTNLKPPLVEKTKEHEELPSTVLIKDSTIVKIETGWDHPKTQNFLNDTLTHKQNKLEPKTVRSERKIIQKNNEYVWDSLDKIPGLSLFRYTESSEPEDISVKTENSEFKGEIDKWPEIIYDDWKIKNEEVESTEELLIENKNKSQDCSSKQIEALKTENSKINDETEKWAEVTYDDWKIKSEEVHIKEEHLLENKINVPSRLNIQEKTEWKNHLKRPIFRRENSDEINLFKCDECKYQTCRKDRFKQHLLKHKNPDEIDFFKCDKCEYRTVRKDVFKRHLVRHKNPDEVDFFKCDKCEYQTCRKSNLTRHLLRHKNPDEIDFFKCDKCEYQTLHKYYFKKHLLNHKSPNGVDFLKCYKCKYRTYRKDLFKLHVLNHKNPDEIVFFKCDKCEYRTRRKLYLKQHLLKHKNLDKTDILKCDKCKYETCRKDLLKQHVLTHKNPDEIVFLKCDKCEYQTRYKCNLKRHFIKHKNADEIDF